MKDSHTQVRGSRPTRGYSQVRRAHPTHHPTRGAHARRCTHHPQTYHGHTYIRYPHEHKTPRHEQRPLSADNTKHRLVVCRPSRRARVTSHRLASSPHIRRPRGNGLLRRGIHQDELHARPRRHAPRPRCHDAHAIASSPCPCELTPVRPTASQGTQITRAPQQMSPRALSASTYPNANRGGGRTEGHSHPHTHNARTRACTRLMDLCAHTPRKMGPLRARPRPTSTPPAQEHGRRRPSRQRAGPRLGHAGKGGPLNTARLVRRRKMAGRGRAGEKRRNLRPRERRHDGRRLQG